MRQEIIMDELESQTGFFLTFLIRRRKSEIGEGDVLLKRMHIHGRRQISLFPALIMHYLVKSVAEFILEKSYQSRRIIRLMSNSS